MVVKTKNLVILVIEDDPPLRGLLQDVLGTIDYKVVAVPAGEAALQMMQSQPVDLITLDLELPGVSGGEILATLHQQMRSVPPVIIITAGAPVAQEVRAKAQAVIAKPFDIDALIATIHQLLPQGSRRVRRRTTLARESHG